MTIQERKALSKSTQFKMVFKNSVNNHNTLFGGEALKWMDEVAYITAIRFCNEKLVTVSTGNIRFLHPIPIGSIIQIRAKVLNVGNVKIEINVEIFLKDTSSDELKKSVEGNFFFAAVDENAHPKRLSVRY